MYTLNLQPKITISILCLIFAYNYSWAQITGLSQNSNYLIYKAKYDQIFLSSFDGLNIYDGRNIKIYKPSGHDMIGNNIQSGFYEDSEDRVWFTTYSALHNYNPLFDRLDLMQFRDGNNDLIETDYRIIHQSSDTIWVQAGDMTVLYNTQMNLEVVKFCSEIPDYYTFYVQVSQNKTKIVTGDPGELGVKVLVYDNKFELVETIHYENFEAYGLQKINDCILIATSFKGEVLVFDHCRKEVIEKVKIDSFAIHKIDVISNCSFRFYSEYSGIFEYNLCRHEQIKKLLKPEQFGLKGKKIISYCQLDSNHFILGVEGLGVLAVDLNEKQFLDDALDDIWGDKNASNFVALPANKVFLRSDANSFYILDLNERNIRKYKTPIEGSINSSLFFEGRLLFSIENHLFEMNEDEQIRELLPRNKEEIKFIDEMIILGDKIIAQTENYKLVELNIDNESYFIHRNPLKSLTNLNVTNLSGLINNSAFASINDIEIVKIEILDGDTLVITDSYPIGGELKDLSEVNDSVLYISTSLGLFVVNNFTHNFKKVSDKDKLLDQTIYSLYPDAKRNLWMSTNSGILVYDYQSERINQFGKRFGIQGMEYHTGAHCRTEDGYIVFGGTNGIDVFHPDSIQLSNYLTPIYVNSILINEQPYIEQSPNTIDSLTLTYEKNSIYFEFHAIDYSYPFYTKTKYMMTGKDNDFSPVTTADGSARYSNLEPGSYEFKIKGANADGVWNPTPRSIHITILPPWYATWWARFSGALLLTGFIYWIFRSYYKRQLREKDLALREANLTIIKQQALAKERKRIAGEMHDDLGGGLTSIRFLSQKIFKNLTNDELRSQVSKVANISEKLVKNMSEIIWAMNAENDTMHNMVSYVRQYAHEFLEDFNLQLDFEVSGEHLTRIPLSGQQRRNIFLVVKEALNNAAKHSEASHLNIDFTVTNRLHIQIKDNGIGFIENKPGNGMKNMKHRIQVINGTFDLKSNNGVIIQIYIPLLLE